MRNVKGIEIVWTHTEEAENALNSSLAILQLRAHLILHFQLIQIFKILFDIFQTFEGIQNSSHNIQMLREDERILKIFLSWIWHHFHKDFPHFLLRIFSPPHSMSTFNFHNNLNLDNIQEEIF